MTALSITAGASSAEAAGKSAQPNEFNYVVDQFADLQVLRYQVPGFEQLNLQQKELLYYLSQAANEGRDILFDQNGRYNLAIRRTLEAVYLNYKGDKTGNDYQQFVVYLKRVWFANGIHHHYGEDKFVPGFSKTFFITQVKALPQSKVPTRRGQSVDAFLAEITPVIFDPTVMCKKVNQAHGEDLIKTSANNYYEGDVTQKEVEDFYGKMKAANDARPVAYGLNSRLAKVDGKLIEKVWKIGGLYSPAIDKIIYWLQKAETVSETPQQKAVITKLIDYYQKGDLKLFDEYAILWVHDTQSQVDFVNGFTETYGDPLGIKASWESTVNFKNIEATKRTEIISANAQWFEDNSPVDKRFKKEQVKGVTAKVITVTQLAGDCYPATPIGINLPNSNWIRKEYGSKSVTIENITEAYDKAAQKSGFNEEFVWSAKELQSIRKYGFLTDNLHTDLHECLGHGSGKLLPGVDRDALKAYSATIEEARADLFGLYYVGDSKLVELGILPDKEAYKAEYYKYMMNGLMTQLTRIEPGKTIEEAHMRNRQLIARWVYEHGKAENVVEFKQRNGKTFVVVNDYEKMRNLLGVLLAEIQRVKSEGDFEGARKLVEDYGVKVDPALHNEILSRYKKLGLKPYKGFVNPVLTAIKDTNGTIKDIKIAYTEGYAEQMLRYSSKYSSLPTYNE
jgi:dipeptidyl-peptidase III